MVRMNLHMDGWTLIPLLRGVGLGAFSSPLVATHFATQERWSFHYLISLGIAISNVAFLTAAFRLKTQDGT